MIDLLKALRFEGKDRPGINPPPRLAFVGSGGKTTALFQLARGFLAEPYPTSSLVLITTTTHLAASQASYADHHYIINSTEDITRIQPELQSGVLLLTGPENNEGRLTSLNPRILEQLYLFAEERHCPILIEADGSRRLPLKAPSDHEPVIPPFIDGVVVVAGLVGLGKPLSPTWVHHPERYSSLTGLRSGDPITPQSLVDVLLHNQGGLKNIPSGARRIVLLNQADTTELQDVAKTLADQLLSGYDAVIIASLDYPESQFHDLMERLSDNNINRIIMDGQNHQYQQGAGDQHSMIYAVHEPVAGIILAAGGSRRMRVPKQLLLWHGIPLIQHVVITAIQAGLQSIIVVTGAHSMGVKSALEGLPVYLRDNPSWKSGLNTSLKIGLQGITSSIGSVIFILADQPQVPVSLLRGLIDRHSATLPSIVAPIVNGQRCNPTLFDRRTFPDFGSIDGDTGGRQLFSTNPVEWLPWQDESLLLDVDTEADYQRLLLL